MRGVDVFVRSDAEQLSRLVGAGRPRRAARRRRRAGAAGRAARGPRQGRRRRPLRQGRRRRSTTAARESRSRSHVLRPRSRDRRGAGADGRVGLRPAGRRRHRRTPRHVGADHRRRRAPPSRSRPTSRPASTTRPPTTAHRSSCAGTSRTARPRARPSLFFHGGGYIFGHIDLFDGPVSRYVSAQRRPDAVGRVPPRARAPATRLRSRTPTPRCAGCTSTPPSSASTPTGSA